MLRNWGYFLITLFAGIILAFLAITPPAPQSPDIAAERFSSGRAMVDVQIIAAKPHPTGSAENAKVRDYLETRMTSLGMDVYVSESELTGRPLARLNNWSGDNKEAQTIYNVIGILPGQDRSKPALLLMAHHDTVWGSPGASDDTVGIASILEIVRALKEKGDQKRDVIVLFTDAEEFSKRAAAEVRPICSKLLRIMVLRLGSSRAPCVSRASHLCQYLCIIFCLMILT